MLNTYNTTLFNHSPQIGFDSLEREVGRITHTVKNTQARVFYWPMVTWSLGLGLTTKIDAVWHSLSVSLLVLREGQLLLQPETSLLLAGDTVLTTLYRKAKHRRRLGQENRASLPDAGDSGGWWEIMDRAKNASSAETPTTTMNTFS